MLDIVLYFLYFLCLCFFIFHKNLFIMLYIVFYYADACTIVIIYYVERTLVNCYSLCPIQLL